MNEGRRIVLVAAAAENGVIGRDGGMPWHMPDDLKHFKAVTLGHPVVMGRRTWQELGCTPLPGRTNIVLTRAGTVDGEGCMVASTPAQAIELAGDGDVMIIGGGDVYRLFLAEANVIELTRIHAIIDGDTTFPEFGDDFTLQASDRHETDDRHAHAFTFETWTRISDPR
ncbi:MAG: dihydrofolate reductase [Phycisphaerales bacterium]|nr:dihydrofolate reductase [Phycisphaerales bacterium]